jgi:hypothetical protein
LPDDSTNIEFTSSTLSSDNVESESVIDASAIGNTSQSQTSYNIIQNKVNVK